MTEQCSPVTAPPADLAERIALYLDDKPYDGGHSDAAGANCWELLEEAMEALRGDAQSPEQRLEQDMHLLNNTRNEAIEECAKLIESGARMADLIDQDDLDQQAKYIRALAVTSTQSNGHEDKGESQS